MPPSMHRGARAPTRAIAVTARPTYRGIWISDELLAESLHRFACASAHTFRRHGSNVPGPLEHRKRAAHRRMNNLALGIPHAPPPILPTIPDLSSLTRWAKRLIDPTHTFWHTDRPRWQPPNPPASKSALSTNVSDRAAPSANAHLPAIEQQTMQQVSSSLTSLHPSHETSLPHALMQQAIASNEVLVTNSISQCSPAGQPLGDLDMLSGLDLYTTMTDLVSVKSGMHGSQFVLDRVVTAFELGKLSLFQAHVLIERCWQAQQIDVASWLDSLQTSSLATRPATTITDESPTVIVDALRLISANDQAAHLGSIFVARTMASFSANKSHLSRTLRSMPVEAVANWGLFFAKRFCDMKEQSVGRPLISLPYGSHHKAAWQLSRWLTLISERLSVEWDLSKPEWTDLYHVVAPYCEPAHLREHLAKMNPRDASRVILRFWTHTVMSKTRNFTWSDGVPVAVDSARPMHDLEKDLDSKLANVPEGLVTSRKAEYRELAPFLQLTAVIHDRQMDTTAVSGMILGLLAGSSRWEACAWYIKAAKKNYGILPSRRELLRYLRSVPTEHAKAAGEIFQRDPRIAMNAVPSLLPKLVKNKQVHPKSLLAMVVKDPTEARRTNPSTIKAATPKDTIHRNKERWVDLADTANNVYRAALLISADERFSARSATNQLLPMFRRLRANRRKPSVKLVKALVKVAIERPILARDKIPLATVQWVLQEVEDVVGGKVAFELDRRIHEHHMALKWPATGEGMHSWLPKDPWESSLSHDGSL